jgi:integrase/recombinase XerD
LVFESIDEDEHSLKIHGKGNRERIIYLENKEVVQALSEYLVNRRSRKVDLPHIFISKFGEPLSTQAVRYLVTKYTKLAGISKNITPHVFRHSFASLLLEEGVDIKFIQDFMGHSSISTTQIYLHTSNEKRREVLAKMHPRQKLQAVDKEGSGQRGELE